jgi:hypothetical protein
MKKNYRIVEDLYYTSIEETDDDADDYSVFSTVEKAKKQIIRNMKREIDNYKTAIKRIRTITKDNLYGKAD